MKSPKSYCVALALIDDGHLLSEEVSIIHFHGIVNAESEDKALEKAVKLTREKHGTENTLRWKSVLKV